MHIDLTEVILLVITILFAILQRYIIPWLKTKMVQASNDDLDFWVDFFVKAAEEQYKTIANSGKLKFEYVREKLEAQGFTYDSDIVEAIIDGKVRELFNWGDYPVEDVKVGGTDE